MKRRSGLSFVASVLAPWCLGTGLLLSFTADAGQDPAQARGLGAARNLSSRQGGRHQLAKLTIGAHEELQSVPYEREPHDDLKPGARQFPEVDRANKGDPVVAIRPTLEGGRAEPSDEGEASDEDVILHLGKDETFAVLAPRPELSDDDLSDAAPDEGAPTTQRGAGHASPAQGAAATTPRITDAMKERAAHGATPQVSRAMALASSTPAQPDALPVAAAPLRHAVLALGPIERPDYSSRIDPDKIDRERRCLAEAVYFESRGEPEEGQAAVAQVVLNRVASGLYPSDVCGVVYQNRQRYHRCQFSFACEGRRLRITEGEAWATAVRIANEVMDGRAYNAEVGPSTHYHANYVRPGWARRLKRTDKIGNHIFYRLKPGQT